MKSSINQNPGITDANWLKMIQTATRSTVYGILYRIAAIYVVLDIISSPRNERVV
jgi:hypothetical protein